MGWERQNAGGANRGPMVMASAAATDAHALASYREGQAPPRDATAAGAAAWRGLCVAVGATGLRASTFWRLPQMATGGWCMQPCIAAGSLHARVQGQSSFALAWLDRETRRPIVPRASALLAPCSLARPEPHSSLCTKR